MLKHACPTDFENVPNSGSGMSGAQLPYSPTDFTKFESIHTLCQLFSKLYLIQVQVCPRFSFLISRPMFTKFDTNITLFQLILKIWFRFRYVQRTTFISLGRFSTMKMLMLSGSYLSLDAGAEPASIFIKNNKHEVKHHNFFTVPESITDG